MRNKIVFALLLIILASNASAIKISLSPSHISLSGKTGENLCQNISLSSDKNVLFYGEDKWSVKKPKNSFNDYNLSSSSLELTAVYLKEINVKEKENIAFCIKAKNPGNFYGTLIYKSSSGTGAIGSLIELKISKIKKMIAGVSNHRSLSGLNLAMMSSIILWIVYYFIDNVFGRLLVSFFPLLVCRDIKA